MTVEIRGNNPRRDQQALEEQIGVVIDGVRGKVKRAQHKGDAQAAETWQETLEPFKELGYTEGET